MSRRSYKDIDTLRLEFQERKSAIRKRLADFAAVKPDDYFYELVYCLLTPQSSAMNAALAVERLKSGGSVEREIELASLLANKESYIRFHNTKAKHVVEARRRFHDIMGAINNGYSSEELREWLVRNVYGLGWKEASHFLRNIGHRNLAILDRHILRNLKRHNVIRSLPTTLTRKRYHAIEHRFKEFSDTVGISTDELDLLFWSRETGEILK
jgi:N-glycosylase/DNA lyase